MSYVNAPQEQRLIFEKLCVVKNKSETQGTSVCASLCKTDINPEALTNILFFQVELLEFKV